MKLFITKLSAETDEARLSEIFSPFGEVLSVRVIRDKKTGRSKNYGFVEMDSREAGEEAIKQLHNTEVDGRKLVVLVAFERKEYSMNGQEEK